MADMDIHQVLEYLPQRFPILMVDRVLECEPGKRILALKNVSANEPHFPGHFPGRPVMPGVMIIESMAQTAAVLVVRTLGPAAEGKLVYFMSVEGARFRKPVVPGDTLHVHVRKARSRGNVWKFSGEAKVNDQTVAEATYTAIILAE